MDNCDVFWRDACGNRASRTLHAEAIPYEGEPTIRSIEKKVALRGIELNHLSAIYLGFMSETLL